ncbi:hypothetical protein BsWGS_11698 [Bradybaena similaris]
MATAKVWSLKQDFNGEPKLDDFVLKEEVLPSVKDGEILIEALYLSIDPYVRMFITTDGLPGEQVARITQSRAPGFPEGALVSARAGWRSKTVAAVNKPLGFGNKIELLEVVPGLSPSLWLGAAGMPGGTAFLGFQRCNPKEGETIVVSAASGAVGSIVGQLAKLQGLKAVGLVGSEEKCEYIKKIGFDHAVNYKQENISQVLERVASNGVDIYFDNVGGNISDTVYGKLRESGRVLVCGQISTYNKPEAKVTNWNNDIILKELKIEGYNNSSTRSAREFPTARRALISLLQQGKLKAMEHITEGFENMPKAFLELFSGSNIGKAIVRV